MVDVVVNHFAWDGPYKRINYSQFDPFNEEKYFHPFCLIEDHTDANDTIIQNVSRPLATGTQYKLTE